MILSDSSGENDIGMITKCPLSREVDSIDTRRCVDADPPRPAQPSAPAHVAGPDLPHQFACFLKKRVT